MLKNIGTGNVVIGYVFNKINVFNYREKTYHVVLEFRL